MDRIELEKSEIEDTQSPSSRNFKILWTRYHNQITITLIFVVLCFFFILITYIPPFNDISRYSFEDRTNLPPSLEFWMGTNRFGQNNFNLLLRGFSNSILFGFVTAVICTSIAIFFGVIGPYLGGVFDYITQFITNVTLAFPVIPFILLLSALTQERSVNQMILVIALFYWPWAARSMRAQVLSIKERDYIKISKMSGVSSVKIAIVEVLPGVLSYAFLTFTISVAIAISTEAGIAMLGFGQKQFLTLGFLLDEALTQSYIINAKYYVWIPPGVVLTLFLLLIYLVHGSVSSLFNPKTRENA